MTDFDWTGYLTLAQRLAAQGTAPVPREAMRRSAISRACYAAFNKARWYLRYKDLDIGMPTGPKVHEYVCTQFKTHPDTRRKGIGENLDRLRDFRNRADNSDFLSKIDSLTTTSINMAADFISGLEEL